MTSSKLLKIIFVILLLVAGGELAYFFYIQVVKIPSEEKSLTTNTINRILTSFLEKATVKPKNTTLIPLDERTKEYIEWLKKRDSVMVSSVMTDQSEGEISEIGTIGSLDKGYKLKISVKGKSQYSFYFKDNELPLIKTVQLKTKNEEPIGLNTLKTGDRVIIEETFDTMGETVRRIETKIIKK